ncbi:4-hydroxythreonine-4-phosphate dehydrogenase PdxA [Streptomyces sp. NBC_01352]|uniref:4-hydroxythreonine-4-phosphate dehydrogenase PdxA n=1 Tax=unclassified Streptomyces TaxID=2593676 RepID=UPI0022536F1C|nr:MULTISPECIES: 4-hydroxythreonine-4-phosphate dehydrogenase PdxA [unclassified Streptomyces]MCX4697142.1 4-hydroxythreonine-4-phosphate dehydrogenase PdxA [Streptomyces sp. NBC_01373]
MPFPSTSPLREGTAPRRVLALADDLSGAAETAVALGVPGRIVLGPASLDPHAYGEALVVDLDCRSLPAADAARRVREALRAVPSDVLVLKKADSLLRGNLAAETAACAEGAEGVVVATALPALGRTVRGGVVHLDGVPLHSTDAWRAESTAPPPSISAALGDARTTLVPLEAVRGDALPAVLRAAVSAGQLPVCDAETDADLDLIAGAALDCGPGVRLVGTSGLAAAVGRLLGRTEGAWAATTAGQAAPAPAGGRRERPLVVVVGTADPSAPAQIAQLTERGARHVSVNADVLDSAAMEGMSDDVTVLSIDSGPGIRPGSARRLVSALARLTADRAGDADLVLTGGETARHVLDALGVAHLTPLGQIHHGAVHALTPDGRHVVTRPGSFGDTDSLLRIATALRPDLPHLPHLPPQGDLPVNAIPTADNHRSLPLIAVTMGDGAGIGPEVIVPALLHPDTLARCRPVVIGDAGRLRQAAAILGVDCDIVSVTAPGEAEFPPGRVNVVDLDLLPADLPWGELSALAGEAAYQYVRVAADLALKGAVHGICTAPLNKEALHSAGHVYPGHTELLAHLTGVDEVSMMLSTPRVKVIHVTTHIGLIDAVRRIEPGLVERTVRRGHDAMVRAGVAKPVIGVCGINPHAGENGLFGYGEEEEKIVPALDVLRADGIDARGPLPADTAFFLAGRGDYDLIVAMYHDQGHGPVKVLGIEAGVNLTVGLPVIRTSVDHGTAFDIAGKGVAEAGSMVEAVRQAAEMSSAAVR